MICTSPGVSLSFHECQIVNVPATTCGVGDGDGVVGKATVWVGEGWVGDASTAVEFGRPHAVNASEALMTKMRQNDAQRLMALLYQH